MLQAGATVNFASVLSSILGLILLFAIVFYAAYNDSGHTAVEPYLALALFVPVFLVGAFQFRSSHSRKRPVWPCVFAMVIGMAGICLLIYLDTSNTLVQYDRWIQRGMP